MLHFVHFQVKKYVISEAGSVCFLNRNMEPAPEVLHICFYLVSGLKALKTKTL